MRDLAFYNVGCQEPQGVRRLVVPFRRGLRRVLRPIFLRQVEIFESLCDRLDVTEGEERSMRRDLDDVTRRQDDLGAQLQTSMAFGWDYTAMVRRLAALEDRVEALTVDREGAASRPDERQLSLPFPEFDRRSRAHAC
jgi:hypothetical protein